MRILHYIFGLPPVRGGGLIRYAIDLMIQEKKMGCEVALLVPGRIPRNQNRKVSIQRRADYKQIPTYAVFHPLPIPMGNGILDVHAFTKICGSDAYTVFFEQIRPDLIHVHTLMGLHQEFFVQADIMHIPIVFTTHDYFGICPTANLLRAGEACNDKEWGCCVQCCCNAYSWKKLRLEQSGGYRFYRKHPCIVNLIHNEMLWKFLQLIVSFKRKKNRSGQIPKVDYPALKKYYEEMFRKVTWFHFNSTSAEQIYRSWLGNIKGSTELISHAGIRDYRRMRGYGSVLRLGYFGGWKEHKGAGILAEAVRQLWEEDCRDFELHVYTDAKPGREIADNIKKDSFIKTHRAFEEKQFPKIMNDIDVLIVPSVWYETFGFVLLEAVSCGVLVVFSRFVGAKEILKEYPSAGFAYDGTVQGLKEILKKIAKDRSLLEQANTSILAMDFVFSFELHAGRMLALYRKLIQVRR